MSVAHSLPAREHLVLRGAYLLTMDPALGEMPIADIEIRDGAIEAVGASLVAAGATEMDASACIGMPGLIDTHWHAWGTLLRGVIGDGQAHGWFARKGLLGPHFRPSDTAAGARLALAEGLSAGITTVHDWAHNVISRDDAEANIAADMDLGLRVHFSYGTPSTTPGLTLEQMAARLDNAGRNVDEPLPFEEIEAIRAAWLPRGDGRLSIGINVRGPARSTPDVYRYEFAEARRLGLPLAMHCAGTRAETKKLSQVQILASAGLLGSDLLLAHGNHLPPEDIALVAAQGMPISVSPLSELRLAMGWLQVHEFMAAGIDVSFSLDTTAIAANADPYQAMRIAVGLEGVRLADPEALSPRRALEMATIAGARALGLGDVTGSLTPGKRADVVLVRTDALNVAPVVDPAVAIVHAASPANVDTVIVDGRVLKRAGRLTAVDPVTIVAEAQAALRALCIRAGFSPPAAP